MNHFLFSVAALRLVQFLGNSANFHVLELPVGAGVRRQRFYEPTFRAKGRRIESLTLTIMDESMLLQRMEELCKQTVQRMREQASPPLLSRALNTIAGLALVPRRKAAWAMEMLAESLGAPTKGMGSGEIELYPPVSGN
jgi:hypothetical protein